MDGLYLTCCVYGEVVFGSSLFPIRVTLSMPTKLQNHKLNSQELIAARDLQQQDCARGARAAAKITLAGWYQHGFHEANRILPQLQINANLRCVSAMPYWMDEKTTRDA